MPGRGGGSGGADGLVPGRGGGGGALPGGGGGGSALLSDVELLTKFGNSDDE